MANPIQRDGIDYPSQAAFARAVGVKRKTVARSLDRGTLADCGKGRERPLTYLGVQYPSIRAASIATGHPYETVRDRRKAAERKIKQAQNNA